jgi:hypothetical protein
MFCQFDLPLSLCLAFSRAFGPHGFWFGLIAEPRCLRYGWCGVSGV